MADEEVSRDVPSDEHLSQDVAPGPEDESRDEGPLDAGLTPGQTNAGQQVGGLASATGYGKDLDPEKQPDGNNPV